MVVEGKGRGAAYFYELVCFERMSEAGTARGKSVSSGTPSVQVLANRIHQVRDAVPRSTKGVKHAKTSLSGIGLVVSTSLHHHHYYWDF